MKKYVLVVLLTLLFECLQAQSGSGTQKICPNTPKWNANASMYNDENFMYTEYAKGPNGCWWLKVASFATYDKGQYIFKVGGVKKYYTYSRKNGKDVWSSGNACVPNPFTGKW